MYDPTITPPTYLEITVVDLASRALDDPHSSMSETYMLWMLDVPSRRTAMNLLPAEVLNETSNSPVCSSTRIAYTLDTTNDRDCVKSTSPVAGSTRSID